MRYVFGSVTIVLALLCAGARIEGLRQVEKGDGGTAALAALQVERPTPSPLPRQWVAGKFGETGLLWPVDVVVVETAGVCLYITRTRSTQDNTGVHVEMLNKKDLLQGRGC